MFSFLKTCVENISKRTFLDEKEILFVFFAQYKRTLKTLFLNLIKKSFLLIVKMYTNKSEFSISIAKKGAVLLSGFPLLNKSLFILLQRFRLFQDKKTSKIYKLQVYNETYLLFLNQVSESSKVKKIIIIMLVQLQQTFPKIDEEIISDELKCIINPNEIKSQQQYLMKLFKIVGNQLEKTTISQTYPTSCANNNGNFKITMSKIIKKE
ncbi:hypothetical protein RFI_32155 [Reticulomyxa filosa]|uniref:Uncharacterized protein n=1 Tax=Reticulomyxa filosa TaxID=46433 RepID=X6LV41_RETFI|nr:hypothetical protein RFI_32155 [Reticulomyxa filosa]|eukprot:ETO05241.1 hypothetical protein RFI_32155 [Reticulomyxa filosa]